jgi:tRNA(Ile)-lysidine synthase
VLIACSGGPDSTALALLVARTRPDLRMVLGYVAHGLRSADVDDGDMMQVAALAELLDVGHVVLRVRVVRSGAGVESDARDVRHAALEEEADRLGLDFVLHGHHADDQAETLLLRIARGTGVDGLAGMAPVAGRRVRPLLDVRRLDLHRASQQLVDAHIAARATSTLGPARQDPMNEDEDVARVRLRREVLPALGRVSPDPVGALTRLAALARDDSDVLDRLVDELLTSLPLVTFGRAVLVPSVALRALPRALARRVVRAMLHEVALTRPDAVTVERLLSAPDGWRATLPGPVDASVDRGRHILVPVSAVAPMSAVVPTTVRLDVASGAAHMHAASRVRLTFGPAAHDLVAELPGGMPPGMDPARLTVELCREHHDALHVRTRRDGDRIRTPAGTRLLGDILREVGVPRALRDLMPVVTGADDLPLWVPGVVVDLVAQKMVAQHPPARPA